MERINAINLIRDLEPCKLHKKYEKYNQIYDKYIRVLQSIFCNGIPKICKTTQKKLKKTFKASSMSCIVSSNLFSSLYRTCNVRLVAGAIIPL